MTPHEIVVLEEQLGALRPRTFATEAYRRLFDYARGLLARLAWTAGEAAADRVPRKMEAAVEALKSAAVEFVDGFDRPTANHEDAAHGSLVLHSAARQYVAALRATPTRPEEGAER